MDKQNLTDTYVEIKVMDKTSHIFSIIVDRKQSYLDHKICHLNFKRKVVCLLLQLFIQECLVYVFRTPTIKEGRELLTHNLVKC